MEQRTNTSEQRVSSMERLEKSSTQALISMDLSATYHGFSRSTTGQAMSPHVFSVISAAQAIHSMDQRRRPLTEAVIPSPQAIAPSIFRRAPWVRALAPMLFRLLHQHLALRHRFSDAPTFSLLEISRSSEALRVRECVTPQDRGAPAMAGAERSRVDLPRPTRPPCFGRARDARG